MQLAARKAVLKATHNLMQHALLAAHPGIWAAYLPCQQVASAAALLSLLLLLLPLLLPLLPLLLLLLSAPSSNSAPAILVPLPRIPRACLRTPPVTRRR